MRFRTKIWLLPASAALVFLVGLLANLAISNRTSGTLGKLRAVDDPYLQVVVRIDRHIEQFRLTLQSAASEGDIGGLAEVEGIVTATRESLKAAAAIEGKQAVATQIGTAFDAYQMPALQATRALLTKASPGDSMARMQAAQAALTELMKTQIAVAREAAAAQQEAADRGVRLALWVNLATGAIVLLVLGVASLLIVDSVWKELGAEPAALRAMAQQVAEGRLDVAGPAAASTAAASLAAAMLGMTANLRDTVGTIRRATDAIATASTQIACGNTDLSDRTEQAASRLQETASSMEELTGTVHQSAASARQADAIARKAADAAAHGSSIVSQVVTSMGDIDQASRKIQEIIGVIDGIAFQTNILALNAAVEAARAGEHGRGFAVVASEVRTLAQRSAGAAKEIKTLIQASCDRVGNGSRLVRDAGDAMDHIVAGVKRVTDTLGEITEATSQQASGIGQVNEAVSQLDHMTQQNAALVEESAAATSSLREQAASLAGAVARFQLGAESREECA